MLLSPPSPSARAAPATRQSETATASEVILLMVKLLGWVGGSAKATFTGSGTGSPAASVQHQSVGVHGDSKRPAYAAGARRRQAWPAGEVTTTRQAAAVRAALDALNGVHLDLLLSDCVNGQ